MMGFSMSVVPSRLSESDIRSAQLRLSVAYRFGRLYLRSSRTIQGRGLRIFSTTGTTIDMSANAFYFVCHSLIFQIILVP